MGATTTQGTGPGSATEKTKKTEYHSLGVNKLVGPKIVFCSQVLLEGKTGLVYIPSQCGQVSVYCIPLTSIPNSEEWRFGVTAGDNDIVNFMISKIG
jgi:hypothetical protein